MADEQTATQESAKAELVTKQADPAFMASIYDSNAEGHKESAKEWGKLMHLARGGTEPEGDPIIPAPFEIFENGFSRPCVPQEKSLE